MRTLRAYWEEKERPWAVFLLLFALVFLRFCVYGLRYYPQLDDYIQLHNQAAYYTFSQVVLDMGLLASRPLASVMDVLFWSNFWPCLILAVALLSALFALSACLFRKVWSGYFGTGYLFLVLYILLPLGMEGTYWLSASTRVVPALFFTALAMDLFQRWCRGGRRRFLALYFPVQLLSFCFYEQGLVLSVTGVLLVGLLELRREKKRALFALLTFVNVGIYFAFTGAFSTTVGQLGSRLRLTLPWQPGYWQQVFLPACKQLYAAFLRGGFRTLFSGLRRGLSFLLSEAHFFWLLLLLALCLLLFLAAKRFSSSGERKQTGGAVLVGFLMALAPVSLFFVLSNPSVALRNTVFSFCGLSLMADAAFGFLLRRLPAEKTVGAVLCAALALLFSIASVSELHDYRETYLADQRAAQAICAALSDGEGISQGTRIGVLNLSPNAPPEQNYKYHEHIHGATESPWALTGLLTCVADNKAFPTAYPLPAGPLYTPENRANDPAAFPLLLFYDGEGTALPVTLRQGEGGLTDVLSPGGQTVARIVETDGCGALVLDERKDPSP